MLTAYDPIVDIPRRRLARPFHPQHEKYLEPISMRVMKGSSVRFLNHRDTALALINGRHKLPRQIDLVVGIPRSGMIPASMLATQLNVPLVDVDGFLEGRIFRHGSTKRAPATDLALSEERTVVIMDDMIGSGRAFRELKAAIAERKLKGRIFYCAVWGTVRSHPDIDCVLETVSAEPVFPWNLMHHGVLAQSCVDIDGVLCANPQGHESFEGRAYDQFLESAISLHRTSGKIGWLVTSRLEKHRKVTEDWLARHEVDYEQLVMASPEDKTDSPTYKARVYRETGARMFIESEEADAAIIAKLSGRPVICIGSLAMIYPDDVDGIERYRREEMTNWQHIKAVMKLNARNVMGDRLYYTLKDFRPKVRIGK